VRDRFRHRLGWPDRFFAGVVKAGEPLQGRREAADGGQIPQRVGGFWNFATK
jgi:hypothetical protein